MANHTIDCKFCGADQRSVANCCHENAAYEKKLEKEAQKLRDEKDDLNHKYGIQYGDYYSLIRKLEKMDDKCLKIVAKEVKEARENKKKREDSCEHKWEAGFLVGMTCKKCGLFSD